MNLMQISMKLALRDAPGQLIAALRPISAAGGNIKTVIHEHVPDAEGNVAVSVVIDIPPHQIDTLKEDFAKEGITIIRFGEERLVYQETVILIGHLIHCDLGDTINRVDDTGFAEVTHITIAMPGIQQPSSAQLVVRATGSRELKDAISILSEVAQTKGFLLITPLAGV
jgi:ACT domain-containing protein